MQIELIVRYTPDSGPETEFPYADAHALKDWLNAYLPDKVPSMPADPPQVPVLPTESVPSPVAGVEVPPSLKKPSLPLQTPAEGIPEG